MAVTLKQIATEVGTDVSTVSRVLHRPSRAKASKETRLRIQEAAKRLGYQVHAGAQALVRGRTGSVGILVPDLMDPVLCYYVHKLDELLREIGLQAVPLPTGWSAEEDRRCLEALSKRQVDAVISLYYHRGNAEFYQMLRRQGHHLVFRVVDESLDHVEADCVGIDIADAYESLVRHLVARGYRRIGILGGEVSRQLADGQESHPGASHFLAAHREAGIDFDRGRAIACGNTGEEACMALTTYLRKAPEGLDALIVQSNKLVLGVWHALRMSGVRVPEQMGLATVSDSEICRLLDVPVTVWDQPMDTICRGLVGVIRRRQEGEEGIARMQYASRLIVRKSTSGYGVAAEAVSEGFPLSPSRTDE